VGSLLLGCSRHGTWQLHGNKIIWGEVANSHTQRPPMGTSQPPQCLLEKFIFDSPSNGKKSLNSTVQFFHNRTKMGSGRVRRRDAHILNHVYEIKREFRWIWWLWWNSD